MADRQDGPERRRLAAYDVTPDEFFLRFRDVESMSEVPSGHWPRAPIVREVMEHRTDIRSLNFKFYGILGALTLGTLLSILIRIPGGGG